MSRLDDWLRTNAGSAHSRVAFGPRRRQRDKETTPLSFAQSRLWFLDQLEPGSPTYNNPLAINIDSAVEVRILSRAIHEMVRRHEILRTCYRSDDNGRPYQRVEESWGGTVSVNDLSGLEREQQNQETLALVRNEADTPFDLANGPALRVRLITLAKERSVVVLTVHHITSDAWSSNVMLRELSILYSSFESGGTSPLPDLHIQYADYATWQREWLAGSELARQRDYWRRQLAGVSQLNLPTDRPRPRTPSRKGTAIPIALNASELLPLREFCVAHNVTSFMVGLAALQIVLGEWSKQTDVVVGTVLAGRRWVEVEPLIGFFVNTVALRTNLEGNPTLSEMVKRVRSVCLEAYDHQDLPFEQQVDEADQPRDVGRHPLFQVMLTLENVPSDDEAFSDLLFSRRRSGLCVAGAPTRWARRTGSPSAKFDIQITLQELQGRLSGALAYSTALYDQETMCALRDAWQRVLKQILENPERRLADVKEWSAPINTRGAPESAPMRTTALCSTVKQNAETWPDSVAVCSGDSCISYRELWRKSGQIAHALKTLGVSLERRVGLCMDRTTELIVAMLGILRAGAAYVPLDPTYPMARLAMMVDDARPSVILASTGVRIQAEVPTITLQDIEALAGNHDPDDGPGPAVLVSSAYVMYTSGSTGRPKGVVTSHGNIARLLKSVAAECELRRDDIWAMCHSYSFDFSVWEIWGALMHGARLEIASNDITRSPEDLCRWCMERRVSVLSQTPSSFRQVEVHGGAARDALFRRSNLRAIVFGGEALSPLAVADWVRALSGQIGVVNMYGITETTVHVTFCRLDDSHLVERAASPIGRPLEDLQAYALLRDGSPAPAGVTGELHIGGAGLARGYWKRPGLTASRFVPDSFSGEPGARLYRTGDLAWRNDAGGFEYVGRADQQVKIRGFRVELAEVESALRTHPAVLAAAATALQDEGGRGTRLAALVQVVSASPELEIAIRRHLRAIVPEYMIPSRLGCVERLPVTASGKVDRAAIATMSTESPVADESIQPESGSVLREAAQIVLSRTDVELDQNFFELGGDSMTSIELRAAVRQRGFDFTLQDLFGAKTFKELAKVTRPIMKGTTTHDEAFALVTSEDRKRLPAHVTDALPMSKLQLGMWYHSERGRGAGVYHDVFGFRVRGPSLEQLQRAIAGSADRHPALRTTLDISSFGRPMQLIWPASTLNVTTQDIDEMTPQEQERTLERWLHDEQRLAFREGELLVRIHIHRLGPSEHELWLSFHHAALDGWSVAALIRELCESCAGKAIESPKPLHREFLDLEQAAIGADGPRTFWRQHLNGAIPSRLARTGEGLESQPRVVHRHRRLATPLVHGLHALARELSTPLKTVLLAVHQRVTSTIIGRNDVTSGVVTNGRPEAEEGARVLGLFLNTVPFRTVLSPYDTWRHLIEKTFRTEAAILPHRWFPTSEVEREHGTLFDVAFNYVHFKVYEDIPQLTGVTAVGDRGHESTNVPLFVHFHREGDTVLGLQISYRTDCVSNTEVSAILDTFEKALSSAVANVDQRLWDGTGTSATEAGATPSRPRTIARGNRRNTACDVFNDVASEFPDAIAVTDRRGAVSYRCLHDAVSALSEQILSEIGPCAAVGVVARRSVEAIIGMLAALRSVAAYVPIDTERVGMSTAQLLSIAGVTAVIAPEDVVLPSLPEHIKRLDPKVRAQPQQVQAPAVPSCSIAYTLFTSGTTGAPKAVAMPHSVLTNLIMWDLRTRVRSRVRMAQFSSLTFDASIFETLTTLCGGGTLCVTEEPRQDLRRLARYVVQEGIERLVVTPAALDIVLTEMEECAAGGAWPLREVICTGEQLRLTKRAAGSLRAHGCTLLNDYGPTETHVVTRWNCELEGGDMQELPPIGNSVPHAKLYVLDQRLTPVQIGLRGHLYVGGDAVAIGYIDEPRLTASRFMPDPFDDAGGRMYKTGDEVWRTGAGVLEYIGRSDRQFKIRGYRVEPAQVERAILEFPGIDGAVVLAKGEGQRRVSVGYIQPAGASVSLDALREFLVARIPLETVPNYFISVEQFPQTRNGKVDNRALEALEPGDRTATVFWRTHSEEVIGALWSGLLRTPVTSIDTDFFVGGGDSLLVTQLASKMTAVFGIECGIETLFRERTIRQQADWVDRSSCAANQVPAVAPGGLTSSRLTPTQAAMWFVERLTPGRAGYNISLQLGMNDVIDGGILLRALNRILERHSLLRMRLERSNGDAMQVSVDMRLESIAVADISTMTADEQMMAIDHAASDEATRPFDLEAGPLLRARAFVLTEHRSIVLVTTHHLACDGRSARVVLDELNVEYEALRKGAQACIPAPTVSFHDVAEWQHAHAAQAWERQEAYWRTKLAGLPGGDIAPDFVGRRQGPSTCRPIQFDWQDIGSTPIMRVYGEDGVTPFMLALAALQIVVARWSGTSDVVIGTPVACRDRDELQGVVGPLINIVAIRSSVDEGRLARELLRAVREDCIKAFENRDLPFDRVVASVNPLREADRSPLFTVMLTASVGAADSSMSKRPVFEPLPTHAVVAKCDFDIALNIGPQRTEGAVAYATDRYARRTIEEFVDQWSAVARGMAADPGVEVSSLGVRAHAEVDHGIGVTAPVETGVNQLVEAQALLTPDSIAVVDERQCLSYQELQRRTRRMATWLQDADTRMEDRVALYMDASVELLVAMLGVMKAGCIFTPLDPNDPPARTEQLIDDLMPRLTIASQRRTIALQNVVFVEECIGDVSRQTPEEGAAEVRVAPLSSAAYILYTSGSTGVPKGVVVTHRGLSNYLLWARATYHRRRGIVPVFSSPSSDMAVTSLLVPLIAGSAVNLRANRDSIDWLRSWPGEGSAAPWMKLTPTHLRVLEASGIGIDTDWADALVVGGEQLELRDVEVARKQSGTLPIVNEYGPTETVVGCCVFDVPMELDGGRVPIGRPISNMRLHVLGGDDRTLAARVPGELFIGGDGVARGYWRKPAQTAAKFVPDKSRADGSRVYRSGDIAWWNTDHQLEFITRKDRQTKISGHRVEIAEVERCLAAVIETNDVSVHVESRDGESVLVGVIGESGRRIDEAQVIASMRMRLPSYMVPTRVVQAAFARVTPAGKRQKPESASEWANTQANRPVARHEPRDTVELALLKIWQRVLGRSLSLTDNFFENGGTSLSAVRCIDQINDECGTSLPVRAMFDCPTIRDLRAKCREATHQGHSMILRLATGSRDAVAPSLVCAHAIGGSGFSYYALSQALGQTVDTYALHSPILDSAATSTQWHVESIEALASRYAEAVIDEGVAASLHVAGWSFGGTLALEVAHQLRRRGVHVKSLAFIDTPPFGDDGPPPEWKDDAQTFGALLNFHESHWRHLASLEGAERIAWVLGQAEDRFGMGLDADRLRGIAALVREHERAARRYEPEPYSGRTILFEPADNTHETTSAAREHVRRQQQRLRSLCKELVSEVIPGDHRTMLRNQGAIAIARWYVGQQ